MTYLLDTNICVYALKSRPEIVMRRIRERLRDGIGISALVLAELEHGIAKSVHPAESRAALLRFLIPMEVLPFDGSAAVEYGQIRADLEKRGTPIGPIDMLIAAHARSEGLILVTNNVREFSRVPDLKIEDRAGRRRRLKEADHAGEQDRTDQ